MTSLRRPEGQGQSLNDAVQRMNNQGYAYSDATNLRADSNPSSFDRRCTGIRFVNLNIPRNAYIQNAFIQWRWIGQVSNMNGANFTIRGEKLRTTVPYDPPAFRNAAGQGPNDVLSRVIGASGTTGQTPLPGWGGMTSESVSVQYSANVPSTVLERAYVTSILQEMVEQPNWTSPGVAVFLFVGATSPNYISAIEGWDSGRQSRQPELYIEWGSSSSNSYDTDTTFVGDSHVVCAGQSGLPKNNLLIQSAPYWEQQVIGETYQGMVDENFGSFDANGGGTDLYGSGDQKRGYSPAGLVGDYIDAKTEGDMIVYRHEYAIGGTTLENWWSQLRNIPVDKTDTTNPLWTPQSVGPGFGWWEAGGADSLNYVLAHPSSPNRRNIVWVGWLGNSVSRVGQGSNVTIIPRSPIWEDKRVEWVEKETDMLLHILESSRLATDELGAPAPVDAWVVLPGYQTFMVMNNDPALAIQHWHYPPDTPQQPLENLVWGTSGFGFYGQINFDGISQSVRLGRPVERATITGVTFGSGTIVYTTSSSHGRVDGDLVTISGVTGITAANKATPTAVTRISSTQFSIVGTGTGTYGGNGTMTAESASISNVTLGSGTIIYTTYAPHGYINGDTVKITGVGGITNANTVADGTGYVAPIEVTRISATQFSVARTGTGTYTSGGAVTTAFSKALVDYIRGTDPVTGAANQSTFIQMAALYQLQQYGEWNTAHISWNAAMTNASTVPAVGSDDWYRTYGGKVGALVPSIDGYKEAFRNITDITVNTYMIGETDYVHTHSVALIEEHYLSDPELTDWYWPNGDTEQQGRVMYLDHHDIHPPDLVNSADPTSDLAQADRATTVKTDGVHPAMARFQPWVAAVVDEMFTKIPYAPGFIDPNPPDPPAVPDSSGSFFF